MPPVQHFRGQPMTPTTQKVCCCAPAAHDSDATKAVAAPMAAGETRDPVCGMVVDQAAAKHRAETAGTIYTCPMHPQIRRNAPGSCPICGMALEPLTVTADAQPNHELADMTRRFWIGLAFALPVFVLEMAGHIPWLGLHRVIPPAIANLVEVV